MPRPYRPQRFDALFRQNCGQLTEPLHSRRLFRRIFPRAGQNAEVPAEVSKVPYAPGRARCQNSPILPPAHKGFVHAANGVKGFARDGQASAARGVFQHPLRNHIVHPGRILLRNTGGRRLFGEIEDEALVVDSAISRRGKPRGLRRVAGRNQQIVVMQNKQLPRHGSPGVESRRTGKHPIGSGGRRRWNAGPKPANDPGPRVRHPAPPRCIPPGHAAGPRGSEESEADEASAPFPDAQ